MAGKRRRREMAGACSTPEAPTSTPTTSFRKQSGSHYKFSRQDWNYSLIRSVTMSNRINNHESIPVLPPFESAVADEITEQLIDLYARRAEASEQEDWNRVRKLDIEMDRVSLLREALRDRADQFELAPAI
jgi:hypothetical protein